MKHFELIEIEEQPNGATYVWLNRPELHNAFNAQLLPSSASVLMR